VSSDYAVAYKARKDADDSAKSSADEQRKQILKTAGRDPEQEEIWRKNSSPS
jgi:hypothetical protein